MKFEYCRVNGETSATISLGDTLVCAVVSAEVARPRPDRPHEGFLQFTTNLTPMANPSFQLGRPSKLAVEISNIVEQGIRDAKVGDAF